MIKTFRGVMADDTMDTILLHTNDGAMGYRVVKFQVIGTAPGSASYETVLKIYKVAQTTNVASINFADNTLLAVAAYAHSSSGGEGVVSDVVIFDQEIFNQDIYVTAKATGSANDMNYYLELEQVKLDLGENTVATLKDIRNKELRTMIA